jgi:hypothetical protein
MPADSHHHRTPPSARSRARRSFIAIALCALTSLAIAGPAAAEGQPTVTTTVNNLSEVEHFDGCGGSPGVTEYLTGKEHFQVVDFTDGTLKVSYGRTFRVTEVSDDPALPPRERQGSDQITLHLIDNVPQIFHESFHDLNTGFGDTFAVTTFVAVGGEVRVDHDLVRNPPPPGC